MLDTCEEHSIRNGYRYSPGKCEIVPLYEECMETLKMSGSVIKILESSKYLGLPFSRKGLNTYMVWLVMDWREHLDWLHFSAYWGAMAQGFHQVQ